MPGESDLLGAIEAGGTKFICAVGRRQGHDGCSTLEELRIPTTDPTTTLQAATAFFLSQRRARGPIRALGLATFGPIELDRSAANYGSMLATPKPGWSHVPLLASFARELGCPMGLDTDVNAAAMAELKWGAGRDLNSLAYITVGTGIGVGIIVNGQCVHGLLHPEGGHIVPRRHPDDRGYKGNCPFHGDCLEGLASGPAIAARAGMPASELGANHASWAFVADYLGQLCAQLVLIQSPERIIIGGGVMTQAGLIDQVRDRMLHWLGGYIQRPQLGNGAAAYVVSPGLGERSGLMGAFALAESAASSHTGIG